MTTQPAEQAVEELGVVFLGEGQVRVVVNRRVKGTDDPGRPVAVQSLCGSVSRQLPQ